MFSCKQTTGKHLSQESVALMVNARIQEYGENTKDFEKNEQDSTFFFLKEGSDTKAFGMLKPVTIYYDGKAYPIMGMGNVIALEKSKGYGSILMEHIRRYLDENKKVCMGNTHKDNFAFYEKCGFPFTPGLVDRFVHVDADGKEHRGDWADFAMFVYDPEGQVKDVINGSGDIVIKVPLW
jgi:GNAT superfamily N-acetyltransferase